MVNVWSDFVDDAPQISWLHVDFYLGLNLVLVVLIAPVDQQLPLLQVAYKSIYLRISFYDHHSRSNFSSFCVYLTSEFFY